MNPDSRLYIAGHNGMVGSAIERCLMQKGLGRILHRSRTELDLLDQAATEAFFAAEKPEFVFLAAARVGGIVANNTYRAQFIYENLQIQNNIIHLSWKYGVKKLLFLGSSCIYPRLAPQPIKENALLTGELEYTNEPYAIAKIAGMKMCEAYNMQYGTDFLSVMPTNLYGPNDNYDLEKSHVLPALIRKMHLAHCLETDNWQGIRIDLDRRPVAGMNGKATQAEIIQLLKGFGILTRDDAGKSTVSVTLWGTGSPRREFLYVDDLAEACIFLMQLDTKPAGGEKILNSHINIGTGTDLSILELAELVQKIIGFKGTLSWDTGKPDGTPQKLLDVSKLNSLGFSARISLEEGIQKTYRDYCINLMD
ncbi:MAG: GDP-L-fucose synthase [Bacteroidales bacterium]